MKLVTCFITVLAAVVAIGVVACESYATSATAGLAADNDSVIPVTSAAESVVYHGNVKSKIFHKPGCRHYHCNACTKRFSSRGDAIAAGYRPCKVCKP